MNSQNKLFTKNFIMMICVSIFAFSGNYMILATTPKYCIEIGGTTTMAGLMTSFHMAASMLFRPIWGNFVDTYGRKKTIYIGIFLSIISTIGFGIAISTTMLIAFRIVFGIGFSAITTASGAIVADLIPNERLSEGLAFYGVASISAQAIAPALALELYGISFNFVLYVLVLMWVMCGSFSLLLKYNEKNNLRAKSVKHEKREMFEKTAYKATSIIIFTALAANSVSSFLPLMGEERNISNVGVFYTISAIGLFSSRVIGASIPRIFGEKKTFIAGSTLYALAFMILAVTFKETPLFIAAAFYGLGMGLIFPIMNAVAIRDAIPSRRGAAIATFNLGQDVGAIIGGMLWGYLAEISSFKEVYIVAAIFVIMMTLLYMVLSKKTDKTIAV